MQYVNFSMKILVAALIASLYSAITISLGSFGYSIIQIRISEALAPLPFLMGFPAVAGLALGCVLSNIASPIGLADIVFGSLTTFCAAMLSWKCSFGKKSIACLYPILLNAFGVSLYVSSFYGVAYAFSVLTIGIGESIAGGLVGYPLLCALDKIWKGHRKNSATAARAS